ncbi:hypothetical protein [Acidianus manzaensis]|uniref:NIF system FeS cluster assembly NifU N-terminal domain-containing protein n=1 Tax=Acidianus manzaensis TaxID=282676 RepID=A0A1W6JXE9_9CREN|nr:hypothetical protein [Acidianus manzaensis]ARM74884.1 hypothetical protein B6F84_01800 [Acidianus manzaensis]
MEDSCCHNERKRASDYLNAKYAIKDNNEYNEKIIKTPKFNIKIYYKNESGKVIFRYYSPSACVTTKIALEAIAEWINNGEVSNSSEAISKLSEIQGYKISDDIKNLVEEVFKAIS